MKKILTIGRNPACDICIPDSTDVVSREHAILEIGRGGKYFLIDKSRNGTYVNGIKMASNEKIPVTREDVISFAHIRDLDWALVPKNNSATVWTVSVLAAILLLGAGGWGISALIRSSQSKLEISGNSQHADQWNSPDSRPEGLNPEEEEEEEPKEAQDSTEQKRQAVKPSKPAKPNQSAGKEQKEKKGQQEREQAEVIDAIY